MASTLACCLDKWPVPLLVAYVTSLVHLHQHSVCAEQHTYHMRTPGGKVNELVACYLLGLLMTAMWCLYLTNVHAVEKGHIAFPREVGEE